MPFLRTVAVCSMLLCAIGVFAQQRLVTTVDSLLRSWYYHAKTDTDYLQRPARQWSVRLSTNVSSTAIDLVSNQSGSEVRAELQADMKVTTAVNVSYSGLSLSLSLNPALFTGDDTDWGLNLTAFGNKMGGDVSVTDSRTMKGTLHYQGRDYEMRTGDVRQKMLHANGYYAFNSRRFSYPAAFQQSFIQKRSAGSWLLSASVYGSIISGVDNSRLDYLKVALGGGYGYNWVPARNWVLHISAAPTLCLFSHNRLEVNGVRERLKMTFPEFLISGKGSVVYRFRNWFFGANMIFNASINGEESTLQVTNTRWFGRSYIGLRF